MSAQRSPGVKLMIVGLVGAVLIVPLAMVYWLVSDRQHQARVAQGSVTAAWAGPQVIAGPLLVIPYIARSQTTETVDGKPVTRTLESRAALYLAPDAQSLSARLDPEIRTRASIHRTVVYEAAISGTAQFALPADLARLGIAQGDLLLDEAVVQLPVADPRGLQADARLTLAGDALALRPGLGNSDPGNGNSGTGDPGTGMHAFLDWSAGEALALDYAYTLRGSSAFSVAARGERTDLAVASSWPHPSFAGNFLPDAGGGGDGGGEGSEIVSAEGFDAKWSISNLALGQSLVSTAPPGLPAAAASAQAWEYDAAASAASAGEGVATVRLVEPVDLYSQVERALKYGFLFIGFTFTAFLMFDIVAGARVASAEYLLTGAGLILFFVMLLAFAELIGFAPAYVIASAAIIGLVTSYSAAVLGGWRRAGFIAGLLGGLYAVLYVLLNLEEWSLVIGSLMLFAALASVMYATRAIEWSSVRVSSEPGEEGAGGDAA